MDDVVQKAPTLHAAALWNSQQSFFRYMQDTGRAELAESIAGLLTPVDHDDDKRMPVSCMVSDVKHMVAVAPEPHMAVQMVLRNKGVLLPLFTALRTWQRSQRIDRGASQVPLFLFIQLCARYWGLNNQIAKLDVTKSAGAIEISLTATDPDLFHRAIAEGIIAGLVIAVERFINARPVYVAFPHALSQAPDDDKFKQVFGVMPEFGQPSAVIRYEDAHQTNKMSTEVMVILSHLNSLHNRQFPNISLLDRTVWIMEQLLPITEPTKSLVAQVMNVSVSTLERRLTQSGTSFKQTLLGLKKQLASEYLLKLDVSATQAASLLGYSSSSQFFKAFKHWFGMTPKQFKAGFSNKR